MFFILPSNIFSPESYFNVWFVSEIRMLIWIFSCCNKTFSDKFIAMLVTYGFYFLTGLLSLYIWTLSYTVLPKIKLQFLKGEHLPPEWLIWTPWFCCSYCDIYTCAYKAFNTILFIYIFNLILYSFVVSYNICFMFCLKFLFSLL